MKLLLHVCCAPCLTACLEGLQDSGITPGIFWYNPNIHPMTEYNSRRESLLALLFEKKLDFIDCNEYGLRDFISGIYGDKYYENNRCEKCYDMRLEETAFAAIKNNYDCFSTTLLTSPHQNHELIRKTGLECAERAGVDFYYRDFRPWFREGQKKAKISGRYMQKYCGCIFSEEERFS